MTTPPCFASSEQHEDYMERLGRTTEHPQASYCWDCTPQHQRDMVEEGRCRHMEVKFVVIVDRGDAALQGVR